MSWIDDIKGQGPWNLDEQKDKWGYLNNPEWSSQEDAQEFCEDVGLSLNPEKSHTPCGHWHKYIPYDAKYEKINVGKPICAKDQYGTSYIYVYDQTYRQILRFDTSIENCPIVDNLVITESGWVLDMDPLYGPYNYARSQRGGYCIDKDGSSFWFLFREDGTKNLKLVEIDVSGESMSIVNSTEFSDILNDTTVEIYDGSSNNNYTFWCTSEKNGRILKFQNSDHSLVENHFFNYTPGGYPANDEGIRTLDAVGSVLYWSYFRQRTVTYGRYYHIKGDLNFNVDVEKYGEGLGASTPSKQNYARYFNGYVYFQRVYYPVSGYLRKRNNSNLTEICYNNWASEYLLSFLNVIDGYVYYLNWDGGAGTDLRLRKLYESDLTHVQTTAVGQYTKDGATCIGYAVSAMSAQTKVIMIFRHYDESLGAPEDAMYGASFDTDFNNLSDVHYTRKIARPESENLADDEPVVWPLDKSNWGESVEHWDGTTPYG